MEKKNILFCTGISGSGKSYFIQKYFSSKDFYSLKSATTRAMRDYEQDGREYYFRDESYFEKEKFVTRLFVNEAFWKPGMPKWLYGVPEFEVMNNLGVNFVYDVIQPRYVRQMIDWFNKKKLNNQYDYMMLWFQPIESSESIVKERQNMPNDTEVRKANTCNIEDFTKANLAPNFCIKRLPPDGHLITPYLKQQKICSVEDFIRQTNVYKK
jgi:guanylate kinase